VESGEFANEWVEEYKRGIPFLKESREKIGEHQVEIVGAEIRKLFAKTKNP
jgi:ketol-acid reductoisomerase